MTARIFFEKRTVYAEFSEFDEWLMQISLLFIVFLPVQYFNYIFIFQQIALNWYFL
jgi:hypothetical protein